MEVLFKLHNEKIRIKIRVKIKRYCYLYKEYLEATIRGAYFATQKNKLTLHQ